MEIEHLKEFLVFSKSLNYSAAAKELFIAQPTLSQHISRLAGEVGMPLVSQEGAAHLTPAGNVLMAYAQTIVGDYEKMMGTFASMKAAPEQTVRIADLRISIDIAPTIRRAVQDKGNLPFAVQYVADKELFQMDEFSVLDDDLADISFTFCETGKEPAADAIYAYFPLPSVEGLVVLAADHPLAKGERLEPADLSGLTAITVNTPFWQRSEKVLLESLQKAGASLKSVSGSIHSKWGVPACDKNFLGLSYSDAVRLNPSFGNNLAFLPVERFRVQPYAIFRKDNSNPALPQFIKLWKAALGDS